MLLKSRLDCGFDLVYVPDCLLNLFARRAVQECDTRTGPRRIPCRGHAIKGGIGDHPKYHCMLWADVRPECSGKNDAVDLIHAKLVHQQAGP